MSSIECKLKNTPRRQPFRQSSNDHVEVVKEIFYPEWLANTVVVNKKNGKWRVYVEFTDLNKVCPKEPFPIPRID